MRKMSEYEKQIDRENRMKAKIGRRVHHHCDERFSGVVLDYNADLLMYYIDTGVEDEVSIQCFWVDAGSIGVTRDAGRTYIWEDADCFKSRKIREARGAYTSAAEPRSPYGVSLDIFNAYREIFS